MNITILSGRFVADPETRYTKDSKAVCTFTVAVEDGKDAEGNKRAQFVPCVAFGKTAETISKYFAKGEPHHLDRASVLQNVGAGREEKLRLGGLR